MSAKLHEAQEHCKAAEKYLKTSLLRWKPDNDSAADEYNQAAQCYRIARDLKNSMECYIKASEYYARNNAYFHAAKSLENALLVSKEIVPPEQLYKLAYDACSLYQQQGSGDSGAGVLDKGAKILENTRPDLAVKLYQRAADVSSSESSQHQGAEYMSKASRLFVHLQQYDEAVDSLRREVGFHQEADNVGAVGRLVVAMVLVQLARGDTVGAEQAYKTWGTNCEQAEMQTIETLLQAYDDADPDAARRALRSPFLRSMDVEYSRLTNSIPLPQGIEIAPRSSEQQKAAAASSGADGLHSATGQGTGEATGYAANSDTNIIESPFEAVTFKKAPEPQEDEEEDELC